MYISLKRKEGSLPLGTYEKDLASFFGPCVVALLDYK